MFLCDDHHHDHLYVAFTWHEIFSIVYVAAVGLFGWNTRKKTTNKTGQKKTECAQQAKVEFPSCLCWGKCNVQSWNPNPEKKEQKKTRSLLNETREEKWEKWREKEIKMDL